MPVHPDVQRILDARGPVQLSSIPVDEARAAHLAGATAGPVGPAMDEVDDVVLAEVPVRIYRPAGADGSAVVFFHGGGWVLGSIETHDRQCRQLAEGTGATVVNVGYRLAPEHPFPAAYDDALAVTRHILGGAQAPTMDPTRVALAGDSAGGNLAAAVALACRDLEGPELRAQLLVYPAVDANMTSASITENGAGPFLSAADLNWFYDLYVPGRPLPTRRGRAGGESDRTTEDWRLSPIYAPDVAGLPPALVITAELDPLRDEGEAYAQRLAAAGNAAVAVRYAGVCHGFFGWSHLAEPSRLAMAQVTDWLKRQLAGDR